MLHFTTQKRGRGFSLIELLIVVAMIMILAAISVPRVLKTISDINLRYAATNISGLLQSARMQSVRKNTFYTLLPTTLSTGGTGYYVHFQGGTYVVGDPLLPLGSQITAYTGLGSGAPNEATFTSGTSSNGLSFAPNAGTDNPSFNARGLPCIGVPATGSCPFVPGLGFVMFLSKSSALGNVSWASIAITPSGHIQIWTSDSSGNWVQRD
jgi:prepilin-type N-terminal cleavage/methylation domain-containing protein